MSDSNKVFTDVEFNDVINKQINGEPLYYSTIQVSEALGIPDSKVRYYSKVFEDILQIEFSNRNRRYKKSDIEKLNFIIELTKEGLTLNQIKEYISEKKIDDVKKDMEIKNNPLQIQVFIKALTDELNNQMEIKLNAFQENLFEQIQNKLDQQLISQEKINQTLHEQVAITVDEIVTEKINTELNNFKSYIDEKEELSTQTQKEYIQIFTNQITGLIEEQNQSNTDLKEFIRTTTRVERKEQEKEKSFWHKWFKK